MTSVDRLSQYGQPSELCLLSIVWRCGDQGFIVGPIISSFALNANIQGLDLRVCGIFNAVATSEHIICTLFECPFNEKTDQSVEVGTTSLAVAALCPKDGSSIRYFGRKNDFKY